MPKIEKEEIVYKKPELIFTDSELKLFHDELQNFKTEHILTSGEKISYIDFKKYHKSKRTLSKDGGITVQYDVVGDMIYPSRYEKLENKIKQYLSWCGRQEYIKKMRIDDLEKVSIQEIKAEDINFF